VIEPRKTETVGARHVAREAGGTNAPRGGETATMDGMRHRQMTKVAGNGNSPDLPSSSEARREGPTGVGEHGAGTLGLPRNLGDPDVSAMSGTDSQSDKQSGRDGRREVGVARCTDEAGEATQATLWREGATGKRNRLKERRKRQ
jgi:hypothetical protein